MASLSEWIGGARPRTLPAAAAPVLVGTGAAIHLGAFEPLRAGLAFLVALALQIGVNYSNDYSDGIRGTDENRQGPARLTGGRLTEPKNVLIAALSCFGVAAIAGLLLLALSGAWFLIFPGIAAVIAAWFYTGGRAPYGYMGIGLSELFVFVFFGLMACVGTTWTQIPLAPGWLWALASALGLLSVALLMANNIRDIPSDTESGKKTLAVRLGDALSRGVYVACFAFAIGILTLVVYVLGFPVSLALLAFLVTTVGAAPAVWVLASGRRGSALIPAIKRTGLFTLAWAVEISVFLVLA